MGELLTTGTLCKVAANELFHLREPISRCKVVEGVLYTSMCCAFMRFLEGGPTELIRVACLSDDATTLPEEFTVV